MAAASLAVRVSAQIAEFQKAFADSTKTLDGFKSDFNKTAAAVQSSVAKMEVNLTEISRHIENFGRSFGPVGSAIGSVVSKMVTTFGSLGAGAGVAAVALGGLGIAIVAAVAAFKVLELAATAAFDFVKGAITSTAALGEQLFDLSNKVGVSVESLSALKFVAQQTGTSLEAISGAVFKMSANIGKGTTETGKAIDRLGLSLADLSKQAPEQAFASILSSINKLPSASAQAAAGVAIFGKSFKEISQLKGENLDELIKKAKELGLVMSTETAVAADMLGDKMNELNGIFDGVQQQIGAKLIPVVLTFAELLVGITADAFDTFASIVRTTGEGFKGFVVAVGTGAATVVRFLAFVVDGSALWATQVVANIVIVGGAFLRLAENAVSVAKDLDLLFNFGRQQGVFAGLQRGIEAARGTLETFGGAAVKTSLGIRAVAQEIDRTAAAIEMDFGSIFEGVAAKISKAADEMRKKLAAIGVGAKEGADAAAKALEGLVDKLTGKTILAEAIKWEAALKVVGKEFHRLTDKDVKEFLGVVDEVTDRFGPLERTAVASLKNISIALRALTEKGKTLELEIIPTMSTQTLAAVVAKAQPPQMILPIIPKMSDATLATIGVQISKARIDWAARARQFVEDLKNIGLDAAHGLAEALAVGIRTGDWSQLENNLKDVLANALGNAAAAAVDFIVPGLGRALQPLFSALADKLLGALGLGTKGRDAVKEFAASMGGFDALRERLLDLGAAGDELWRSLTQGVGRNNPEEAKRAIDAITQALDRADKGMKNFADGAMKRIKAFAASFKTAAGETAAALRKLIEAEMPELEMGIDEANARKALAGFADAIGGSRAEIQAEFNRLGLYAGTAFAETLRDEGLAAALAVAGPMFDELNALGSEFGLTLEGSAAQFAEFFRVAKENEDVVSALDAITQMVQGAGDAAFLTHELFSAFSLDAVAQFEKLQQRGVDANSAMALMQPTLQALWEAQQKFGFETDAATQALIDQGVEAGVVGAHMKDTNEKILDVLLAIAKVFKADLPAGFDATEQAARRTARGIQDEFSRLDIEVPEVTIRTKWELGERPNFEFNGPQLAGGGIVRSPTLALIGEGGPEAVIPLSQMGATGPQSTTVILEVDGRALGEVVIPHLAAGVTRLGLGF